MDLLLLTADPGPHSMLPGLSLLGHGVRSAAPDVSALLDAGSYDAVLSMLAGLSCCRVEILKAVVMCKAGARDVIIRQTETVTDPARSPAAAQVGHDVVRQITAHRAPVELQMPGLAEIDHRGHRSEDRCFPRKLRAGHRPLNATTRPHGRLPAYLGATRNCPSPPNAPSAAARPPAR
jgi:hypothetical protein